MRSFEGGIGDDLVLPLEQFFHKGFQFGGGGGLGGGAVFRHQNHVVVFLFGEGYRFLCQSIKNEAQDKGKGNG